MDSRIAEKQFVAENAMELVGHPDDIFRYSTEEQQKILQEKPWTTDPKHFKKVKISAVALLKMIIHARSGGNIEVMGLMQGKIDGDTMIVMDAFALPVEGTETRVNAQAQAYEYMVQYMSLIRESGRCENALGWYHSHPDYGCWLSGIDVGTQTLNQQFSEPYLAIVIDPVRTISAGKVELGAFRTFPKNYVPPAGEASEYQTIPTDKIEDFGVHCKQYYALEVSYFKSSTDTRLLERLWNKYWVSTLSTSPLLASDAYTTSRVGDVARKLEQAEADSRNAPPLMAMRAAGAELTPAKDREDISELAKVTQDSTSTAMTVLQGLMGHAIKSALFNGAPI